MLDRGGGISHTDHVNRLMTLTSFYVASEHSVWSTVSLHYNILRRLKTQLGRVQATSPGPIEEPVWYELAQETRVCHT